MKDRGRPGVVRMAREKGGEATWGDFSPEWAEEGLRRRRSNVSTGEG